MAAGPLRLDDTTRSPDIDGPSDTFAGDFDLPWRDRNAHAVSHQRGPCSPQSALMSGQPLPPVRDAKQVADGAKDRGPGSCRRHGLR